MSLWDLSQTEKLRQRLISSWPTIGDRVGDFVDALVRYPPTIVVAVAKEYLAEAENNYPPPIGILTARCREKMPHGVSDARQNVLATLYAMAKAGHTTTYQGREVRFVPGGVCTISRESPQATAGTHAIPFSALNDHDLRELKRNARASPRNSPQTAITVTTLQFWQSHATEAQKRSARKLWPRIGRLLDEGRDVDVAQMIGGT